MPYFIAVYGFVVFLLLGVIATALAQISPSLRLLRPYAWRVLLWGSIGFLVAHLLLFAVMYFVLQGIGIAGGRGSSSNLMQSITGIAILAGLLIASVAGVFGGSSCAVYFGWRASQGRA